MSGLTVREIVLASKLISPPPSQPGQPQADVVGHATEPSDIDRPPPDEKQVELMRRKMERLLDRSWPVQSVGTIFRVPKHLRDLEPVAYTPQAVSLGPYHRDNPPMKQEMDDHKARYLQQLLSRNPRKEKKRYLGEIRERMLVLEDRARSCYSDPFDNLNSEEFVEMIILDACFVVEFLFKLSAGKKQTDSDPVVGNSWLCQSVIMDMLLLENQLPFFIVREVLDVVAGTEIDHIARPSPFLCLFVHFWPIPPSLPSWEGSSSAFVGEPFHLLHLFRRCMLSHIQFCDEKDELRYVSPRAVIPSATRLKEAGVVFRDFYGDRDTGSLRFHQGTMKMPPLTICSYTDNVFRNLIAFEQCHPPSDHQVTSYAMLMYSLVNTEEDVALLQRCGVLKNSLGSNNEAAKFFSNFCQRAVFQYNGGKLYADVMTYCRSTGVRRYLRSRWPMWWAELAGVYLRSPWTVLGVAAASLLLVLAVLQTVFTILPYAKF